MVRGISGGQRKRVTTGELVVGPMKVLFMVRLSWRAPARSPCAAPRAHAHAQPLISTMQQASESVCGRGCCQCLHAAQHFGNVSSLAEASCCADTHCSCCHYCINALQGRILEKLAGCASRCCAVPRRRTRSAPAWTAAPPTSSRAASATSSTCRTRPCSWRCCSPRPKPSTSSTMSCCCPRVRPAPHAPVPCSLPSPHADFFGCQ